MKKTKTICAIVPKLGQKLLYGFFLLFMFGQVNAASCAQYDKVAANFDDTRLSDVFETITETTGYKVKLDCGGFSALIFFCGTRLFKVFSFFFTTICLAMISKERSVPLNTSFKKSSMQRFAPFTVTFRFMLTSVAS